MGYEMLEHTADLGLRVWAATLDEVFAEAGVALIAVMGGCDDPVVHREEVTIDAPDLDALLVDWLSELLFLFEARSIVPIRVSVEVSEAPWRLRAVVEGPDAEGFVQHGPQVKAVTYHALEIRRSPERVEARVYLDV